MIYALLFLILVCIGLGLLASRQSQALDDLSDKYLDAELLLCLVGQYANANGLKIVGERRPGEPPRYWFERRGDNG